MRHIIGEQRPQGEIDEFIDGYDKSTIDRLQQVSEAAETSIQAPPFAELMMPSSRAGLMAVVDENGYLIPVCTAGDLLRGCKYFWRASQD
jgi:hypothetical protein